MAIDVAQYKQYIILYDNFNTTVLQASCRFNAEILWFVCNDKNVWTFSAHSVQLSSKFCR